MYTCKVSNAVGEVHKSYKLNVLREWCVTVTAGVSNATADVACDIEAVSVSFKMFKKALKIPKA